MTFKKMFLSYFLKSQLFYEKQNLLALSVVSKTTKQRYETKSRRNTLIGLFLAGIRFGEFWRNWPNLIPIKI